jgi:SAM-dependent methyltransferase
LKIDGDSVKHATANYNKPNLKFVQGSIVDVPLHGGEIFDLAVCFEAIEHVTEHEKLLSEVKRLLKNTGVFIVSTPNRKLYTDVPGIDNPFHVKELYLEEFKPLLEGHFKNVFIYGQRVYPSSCIFPFQKNAAAYVEFAVEKENNSFKFVPPENKKGLFFVAVASNVDIVDLPGESHLTDISMEVFNQKDVKIQELIVKLQEKEAKIAQLEASLLHNETKADKDIQTE